MMVLLLLLLLLLLSLSSSLNLVQPPRRAVVVADNNNNNNAVGTAATNNNNNNNDHLSHNHQHQKSPSSSPSSSGTADAAAAAAAAASAAASAAALAVPQKVVALSPFENWCVNSMEKYYQNALSIKCPFFKRRATDVLDWVDQLLRFVVIRHKSLAILPPPPGWTMSSSSSTTAAAAASSAKWRHLSLQQVCDIVRKDWKQDSNRGYYITGRPTVAIYRDDCFFDGPDPDMPVRGLRKYLNAASQLFDQSQSRAELISLETMENNDNSNSSTNNKSPGIIVAKWRMNGILRLPWRPELPEWTGTTTYHCDEQGLIYLHEETWDMSVAQAFLTVMCSITRVFPNINNFPIQFKSIYFYVLFVMCSITRVFPNINNFPVFSQLNA